jgi:hypothetical protein
MTFPWRCGDLRLVNASLRSWFATVLVAVSLVACAPPQTSAPRPDAATVLQVVPPADPAKYEHLSDMKNWRNPYLIIRSDGVGLLDLKDNAEVLLKPEELLDRLARVPPSEWPYGRVVAAAENPRKISEQEAIAIRRNKGIVGGILEGAHVVVRWVPGA